MSDDTALVQAAANSATPLPSGIYTINNTITVGGNCRLSGSGVRGTNDPNPVINGTMIVPGPSFPIGSSMVWVNNGTSRVEDLQIGYWNMPRLAEIGLCVGNVAGDIDRVRIKNVMVTGAFGMALLSARAVSSYLEFVQIWQFQPNTFAAQFHDSSSWTLVAPEIHSNAACTNAGPLWLTDTGGKTKWNNCFGGLISRTVGEVDQWVYGTGMQFYGTANYHENA